MGHPLVTFKQRLPVVSVRFFSFSYLPQFWIKHRASHNLQRDDFAVDLHTHVPFLRVNVIYLPGLVGANILRGIEFKFEYHSSMMFKALLPSKVAVVDFMGWSGSFWIVWGGNMANLTQKCH